MVLNILYFTGQNVYAGQSTSSNGRVPIEIRLENSFGRNSNGTSSHPMLFAYFTSPEPVKVYNL